jgi:hypothetical protein
MIIILPFFVYIHIILPEILFRYPTAWRLTAPPRLSFALSCSGQAPCGAGGAWPLPHFSYHFNRKKEMLFKRFLAEPCRTFNNLMFLIRCCVLYLIFNLTKRPVLAERTCSCDFQEHVRLRSEGPKPAPALAPRAMSTGVLPVRRLRE